MHCSRGPLHSTASQGRGPQTHLVQSPSQRHPGALAARQARTGASHGRSVPSRQSMQVGLQRTSVQCSGIELGIVWGAKQNVVPVT